jgi:hypothetical protein
MLFGLLTFVPNLRMRKKKYHIRRAFEANHHHWCICLLGFNDKMVVCRSGGVDTTTRAIFVRLFNFSLVDLQSKYFFAFLASHDQSVCLPKRMVRILLVTFRTFEPSLTARSTNFYLLVNVGSYLCIKNMLAHPSLVPRSNWRTDFWRHFASVRVMGRRFSFRKARANAMEEF